MASEGWVGILMGGGPAPGVNSVIAAVAIRSQLEGVSVVGIREGFRWLMAGDTDHVVLLSRQDVDLIHFRGGSILATSRANPAKTPGGLQATIASLVGLGVDKLVTIGGDDTAFSTMSLAGAAREAGVGLQVVHVPKTIDNDLDLPLGIDTFGFQTARQLGVELTRNIMIDAQTTSRWYFLVAMGRKAGHLALGIGEASGATVTLIAEEWPVGPIPLVDVVDVLAGAVIKRRTLGRSDGVAVIAEGIVERLDGNDLAALRDAERDEHGHIRIAEIDIGDMLKRRVRSDLASLGIDVTIVSKDIGYELRCADPIAFDLAYCRALGYTAAECILDGGTDVMVSIQGGRFVPIPFDDLLDPETGRARVRLVDTRTARYAIARRYMTRLCREDFGNEAQLARLAKTAGMTVDAFRERFEHVSDHEPMVYP